MRKKLKRALALGLAASMLASSVPAGHPLKNVYAMQNEITAEIPHQDLTEGMPKTYASQITASFASEYAEVGKPLTIKVEEEGSYTYKWYVDDQEVSGNGTDTYIPEEKDLEKWIRVEISSETDQIEKKMFCSKLPVIYLDTGGQAITSKDYYINGTMNIQGNDLFNRDTTKLYDGVIEIKGRGNSTWGMPKKPYKIKLDKKTDIMGMGKSKHWVLLANYSDTSLMRNTISYNLSGDMGMPQMDTTWVDVVLNGKYVGNYQFCEQIRVDKNRIDVFDWEGLAGDAAEAIAKAEGMEDSGALEDYLNENMEWITTKTVEYEGKTYALEQYVEIPDITGGYLMELDEYYDEISKFKTKSGQPIMFKSPEFVNTNQEMMNYIQTYIQAFEDAAESEDYTSEYMGEKKHYSQLFDFQSLVDYWLLNEIFFNEEINKKSTYLYKEIDQMVKMGPIWDMDYSSGGEGKTGYTDRWATLFFNQNAQSRMWYKYLINDPYFVMNAQERYWEIRDTLLEDIIKEGGTIDQNYEYLKESGRKNSELWLYKGQNFEKGTKILKDWLTTHLSWLDQQFSDKESISGSLGMKVSENLSLQLTDADGGQLSDDTDALHAKADAKAEEDRTIKVQIVSRDQNVSQVKFFINGILAAAVPTENQKAELIVLPEQRTAAVGEKDIIEAKAYTGDGNSAGSVFAAVRKIEGKKPAVLERIEVTAPDKTVYELGEELDLSGLKVMAYFSDGTEKEVTSDVTISSVDMDIAGIKTVKVTYEDQEAAFEVTVKEKEPEIPEEPKNPFPDVTENDYFYQPVMWALEKGITEGVGNTGKFMPDASCTRANVVTFLWRMAGTPTAEMEGDLEFLDVPKDAYYYHALQWAYEQGIVEGYGDTGKFMPDISCTRANVVTMLWRMKNCPQSNTTVEFSDVSKDAYYYDALQWAYESGIVEGYGNTGKFMPDASCTRANIVTFLYRAEITE